MYGSFRLLTKKIEDYLHAATPGDLFAKILARLEEDFDHTRSDLNPFTLRAPPESNVCYFHTFENNLRTKRKFTKYLKESCSLAFDRQFSFICFPENAFVSNIFPNLSDLFWLV